MGMMIKKNPYVEKESSKEIHIFVDYSPQELDYVWHEDYVYPILVI